MIHNEMERYITEVSKTVPIEAIAKETNLIMTRAPLNNRQREAAEGTVVLPDTYPTRRIVAG